MTNHTNTTPWDSDPSLKDLSGSLDRLGQAERQAAPAGLADRIAAATMPKAAAAPNLRIAGTQIETAPATAARIGPRIPMRLAAAIGLAATVGAAFMAVRSGTPSPDPAPAIVAVSHPVEDWLTAAELWADFSGDELSTLTARASSLSSSLDESWITTDLFSEEEDSL